MQILYISDQDIVGERFNGYANLIPLRQTGHDPHMLVWTKKSASPDVSSLKKNRKMNFANSIGIAFDRMLSCSALMVTGSHSIPAHPAFQAADIVHLQLLHATPFFSLLSLPRIASLKPTVWTLHDPWIMTGFCVHPMDCTSWKTGCGTCPKLSRTNMSLPTDRTKFMFKYKKTMLARSDIDIIVASQWMQDLTSKSPMFKNHKIHTLPFGINTNKYRKIKNKPLREAFNIDKDAFVICFRHSGWSLKRDDIIITALKKIYPNNLHIIILQMKGDSHGLDALFPTTELGWVENDELLAAVYSTADVFLTPSHESFGMMALEALACGTPVICLENSAVIELCRPPQAGLAVPDNNPEALAAALLRLKNERELHDAMSRRAVEIAAEYSLDRHVDGLLNVYAAAMDRHNRNRKKRGRVS